MQSYTRLFPSMVRAFSLTEAIRRHRGTRGGTLVEVWQKICKLLTLMGERLMQSHLTKTGIDGSIYEKVADELSLRSFCRDKKQVVSKIKMILAFLHL